MYGPQRFALALDLIDTASDSKRLRTLERLITLDTADLLVALRTTANELLQALPAAHLDVLLYEPTARALVALATTDTPLGAVQRALGLNRHPLADGGRAVVVFRTNTAYLSQDITEDPNALPVFSQQLHIRSALFVPLQLHHNRGVLVASSTLGRFTGEDLEYLMTVSRLFSLLEQRVEHFKSQARGTVEAEHKARAREQLARLTPRQREVAALIGRGQTNAQIASELVVTKGTIANHVADILDRLGCCNRSQIAALAAQVG
jgi:two-component system OmpR family sensor kinase